MITRSHAYNLLLSTASQCCQHCKHQLFHFIDCSSLFYMFSEIAFLKATNLCCHQSLSLSFVEEFLISYFLDTFTPDNCYTCLLLALHDISNKLYNLMSYNTHFFNLLSNTGSPPSCITESNHCYRYRIKHLDYFFYDL